jgi:hypothetical protein
MFPELAGIVFVKVSSLSFTSGSESVFPAAFRISLADKSGLITQTSDLCLPGSSASNSTIAAIPIAKCNECSWESWSLCLDERAFGMDSQHPDEAHKTDHRQLQNNPNWRTAVSWSLSDIVTSKTAQCCGDRTFKS